jgi:hypothetical protein
MATTGEVTAVKWKRYSLVELCKYYPNFPQYTVPIYDLVPGPNVRENTQYTWTSVKTGRDWIHSTTTYSLSAIFSPRRKQNTRNIDNWVKRWLFISLVWSLFAKEWHLRQYIPLVPCCNVYILKFDQHRKLSQVDVNRAPSCICQYMCACSVHSTWRVQYMCACSVHSTCVHALCISTWDKCCDPGLWRW